MATLEPLGAETLPQFKSLFDAQIASIGYVPNSLLTMGRDPGLLTGVGAMFDALWYPPNISVTDHWLLTYAASWFAQSYYSAAHCCTGGFEAGLTLGQVADIGAFETSPAYAEREKALLRAAKAATAIPNHGAAAKAADGLKPFFSDQQVVFICGLLSFVGFLNRWNELMDSNLEPHPAAWAKQHMPAFPQA